jgi:hypothetical protein
MRARSPLMPSHRPFRIRPLPRAPPSLPPPFPLSLHAASPSDPAPDPDLQALISEAQGALLTYVTPSNTGHASRLLKALQTILAPAKAPQAPQAGGQGLKPPQARSLSSLPASLPYLCLLISLTAEQLMPGEEGGKGKGRGGGGDVLAPWNLFFLTAG